MVATHASRRSRPVRIAERFRRGDGGLKLVPLPGDLRQRRAVRARSGDCRARAAHVVLNPDDAARLALKRVTAPSAGSGVVCGAHRRRP